MSLPDTLHRLLQSKNGGVVFVGCLCLVFMQAGLLTGHANHAADAYPDAPSSRSKWLAKTQQILRLSSTTSVVHSHPIPKLMDDAEARYRARLKRQSTTLRAAVDEYKRRYKRDPPKGFDIWFKFAKENHVVMVDEFDTVEEDLAPFWELSGKEIRRRVRQVETMNAVDMVRIKNGKATAESKSNEDGSTHAGARAGGFKHLLSRFAKYLPDMDFPINAKAEGRVLVPWEHRHFPNMTTASPSVSGLGFQKDWSRGESVWEAYRRTCHPSSNARRMFSSIRNNRPGAARPHIELAHGSKDGPGGDFNFVPHTASEINFCHYPAEHYHQGHFFSDFRTINVLVPIFSPAKGAGFQDIRIPSHYYYGATRRYTYGFDSINLEKKVVDDMERPWEEKTDKIFWRGATTGGGSSPAGFAAQYQRHRFLQIAHDESASNRTVVFADPPSSNFYHSATVPSKKLNNEIMDVAFVKSVGYYPEGQDALLATHRFGNPVALGEHFLHKYLLDVDGNGYSGRFMAFLQSDSAVVKATIYQEYFRDWIEPWVHFIPLSSGYHEIYNIHAYFSGPSTTTLEAINSTLKNAPLQWRKSVEGDRRLRRIARASKNWKNTIGRSADMEAYVYRLCLEYARLWQDDRDSMSYRS